jgi:predicted protein tyrosine phosphatase
MRTTLLWAADHTVRRISGANILALSRISPHLHVGGQYRRHGWPRLAARGITAVVNLRVEFDDQQAGIAPSSYLYLPTVDDHAPSLVHLEQGVQFIEQEAAQGGGVFVHCGSGVGRAPTMAAAYLVRTGMSPDEAWARIREVRPFIRPTLVQVEQLERFAAQNPR